ncbi:uncharacterized protein LOC121253512 [Juglans microcarpa x Juglans regia]|uniref:uncharacterized protein LOC121253512 n=1 Tax=Juglans microcarpa x Juglans regia TaxID=2249226 RepID=UPI001B7F5A88|nr:uncharacterized protein LOC121253512 [Juglans microcarpa x Juglans regia]
MATNVPIQVLLETYEKASGQEINKEKTAMVFSKNVLDQQQQEILRFWGVNRHHQYERYLGLPPVVGKGEKKTFSDLKHKVWSKLQAWKEKVLSQGGKEILIKAVALSIPSYTMSCF